MFNENYKFAILTTWLVLVLGNLWIQIEETSE